VSVLVLAPESDSGSLAAAIDDVLGQDGDVRGAAGELARGYGALARVLARDATSARRSLNRIWAAVRLALFDLPLPERRK
jgi:urease accessory protein UreH